VRRATRDELTCREFDVVIVGAGIVGCGAARDCARRGLRVALIDQSDIGAGTTSKSTRLIHGGLRYLAHYDFELVREDLREREILLKIAPHLVKPLPFLIPMYDWTAWQRFRMRAGMVLYDLLSYEKSLPWHQTLSAAKTLEAEPALRAEGLAGAHRYFDCQVELPERLALANAIDAFEHGAMIATHTRVETFIHSSDRVIGVRVSDDDETFEVRARVTINASGPWLDATLGNVEPLGRPLLRRTKGTHLVMPRIASQAIFLIAQTDGRVFFVVPWFGYSLVGTTDTDFDDDPSGARADEHDVGYLLQEMRRAFPDASALPVHYGMAGVRALVRKEGVKEGEVSRKHAIRRHDVHGGPGGVVSVLGGKITAYRDIAEQVSDAAARMLGVGARADTARGPLPGGEQRPDVVMERLLPRAAEVGWNDETVRDLVDLYGARAASLVAFAEREPALRVRLPGDRGYVAAQVVHAVRAEGAARLTDVMLRRVPLGLTRDMGREALETVAAIAADELGWSPARRRAEIDEYLSTIDSLYMAATDRFAAG
jgi:glycerol-3-phosphate dehydrogenase